MHQNDLQTENDINDYQNNITVTFNYIGCYHFDSEVSKRFFKSQHQ